MIQYTIDEKSLKGALEAMGAVGPVSRFAASLGMNRTMNEAQDAIRAGLPRKFTVRRERFILDTIYRKPGEDFASKDRLIAGVRIREDRDILAKFEAGGPKTPRSGRALAIPVAVKRNKADIVTKANSVRALLASGKAFIKNGRVWQTVGRGRKKVLQLAYVFKPRVQLPASLRFVATGSAVINQRAVANVAGAIQVELARGLTSRSGVQG